jgi:hypothetical protein
MCRFLPLLLLPFFWGLLISQSASAQPPSGYPRPAAPSPGAPPYAANAGPDGGSQAYNTHTCGTPDEPKPCPPMPRHPLKTYPSNKQ